MAFRLRNTRSTLQTVMDVISSSVHWKSILGYLDYIVFLSRTVKDHKAHLRQGLALLRDIMVTHLLKTFSILDEKIEYLGDVIRSGHLKMSNTTTAAIRELNNPTTQTEFRSFFGLCNVFRHFVPNLSRVATTLYKNLCKNQPVHLQTPTDTEKHAVEERNFLLRNLPVLFYPRTDGHLTIDTDAWDNQLGCVLLEKQQEGTM